MTARHRAGERRLPRLGIAIPQGTPEGLAIALEAALTRAYDGSRDVAAVWMHEPVPGWLGGTSAYRALATGQHLAVAAMVAYEHADRYALLSLLENESADASEGDPHAARCGAGSRVSAPDPVPSADGEGAEGGKAERAIVACYARRWRGLEREAREGLRRGVGPTTALHEELARDLGALADLAEAVVAGHAAAADPLERLHTLVELHALGHPESVVLRDAYELLCEEVGLRRLLARPRRGSARRDGTPRRRSRNRR